ncbi:hypothetical protein JVU11DRAFT_3731 [Chiua virens]|nr:hypothetical protein JVU11DRAFT_3731 [Chiua virens]
MSTSSSEHGSVMLPSHHDGTRPSSGLDSTSTSSLLFSLPSDLETDVTPPSPAPSPSSEAKTCATLGMTPTMGDILDTSRRLGQLAMQDNANVVQNPTRVRRPGWVQHHHSPCVAGDEAGYEADGDVDNDGDGKKFDSEGVHRRVRAGAGASTPAANTTTHLKRRPTFLRIDTRQQRRVASMLATTTRRSSPSPGFPFGDTDTEVDVDNKTRTRRASYTTPRRGRDNARVSSATLHPLRAKLAPLASIRLRSTSARTNAVKTGKAEFYELRHRPAGPSPNRSVREPIGLGIGFPENHPLRSRAFTLPMMPAVVQDRAGPSSGEGEVLGEAVHELGSEWLPYSRSAKWKKIDAIDDVTLCASNPVRLQVSGVLRPTYPEGIPFSDRVVTPWQRPGAGGTLGSVCVAV